MTGGTKGIGLATGLAFARRGAAVTLTHKWGSVDPQTVRAAFTAAGALEPDIVDADAAQEDDVRTVLEGIRERHDRLEAFISNVAFAPLVRSFDEYARRGLAAAIEYSTWPIVSHTRIAKEVFGRYPRYVIGISSQGMDAYHGRYDIVAAAKAALEALSRYMHQRLRDQGTTVNLVKTRFVSTDSLRAIAGDEFEAFVDTHSPGLFTTPEEVADAVVGLCSGLMDGVGGQTVVVDRGAAFFDTFAGRHVEKNRRDSTSLARDE